jgi:hypothetical protein
MVLKHVLASGRLAVAVQITNGNRDGVRSARVVPLAPTVPLRRY